MGIVDAVFFWERWSWENRHLSTENIHCKSFHVSLLERDLGLQASLILSFHVCLNRISSFGRDGGGKSLFRKTFGSLEKPSQRLGMGLGLCEELISFKSCTILFPFFPFSPLRIHKIRIKVEPSVGIWECPFIPGRAWGRGARRLCRGEKKQGNFHLNGIKLFIHDLFFIVTT